MFLAKLRFSIDKACHDEMISDLLIEMFKSKLDYTNTFYNLNL